MNNQLISRDLLDNLTPEMVNNYLNLNGWKYIRLWFNKVHIWQMNELQILIPNSREFADYIENINNALEMLSTLEGRSIQSIFDSIRISNEKDLLRLRIFHPEADDGSIPFSDFVKISHAAYAMLISSASVVHNKQGYLPSRKPAEAVEYMRQTRIGQTEHGSYVIVIQSPNLEETIVDSSNDDNETDENYSRQVLVTLAQTLQTIENIAETVDPKTVGDKLIEDQVENFVNQGGSADLCEAIQKLHEGAKEQSIELSFAWSNSQIDSNLPTNPITITSKMTELSERLGNIVKRQWRAEVKNIIGSVIRLGKESETGVALITLDAEVDGRRKRVRIHLKNQEDHQVAMRSYGTNKRIMCRGQLIRQGTHNLLTEYTQFSLEE